MKTWTIAESLTSLNIQHKLNMKYETKISEILVVFFILVCGQSYSQNEYILAGDSLSPRIIFHDIEDCIVYSNSSHHNDWRSFDLNNDGTIDIKISGDYSTHIVAIVSRIYTLTFNQSFIAIQGDSPKVFSFNEKIDDSCAWSSASSISNLLFASNMYATSGNWINVIDKYIGIKIRTASDTLFGWMKLSVTRDWHNLQCIIKSYAVLKGSSINGIMGINHDRFFSLFPNPVRDYINIEIPKSEKSLLTISSVDGKVLSCHTIINPLTPIDISYLKSGMYFAKLTNDKGFMIKKILKE